MTKLPQYQHMANVLVEEIRSSRYPLGGALPTERELCESFAVSRHTTREALRQLEELGLIIRRQGSGSTVVATSPPVRYEHSVQSIDDLMHQSSASRLQVLSCEEMEEHENHFVSKITLIAKTRCIRIRCIRYLRNDARPLALVDVYMAVHSNAQAQRLRRAETAAQEIVNTSDPRKLDRIEQAFNAVSIESEAAKLLHTKPGSAAFQTVRTYYDLNDRLVIVAHSLYHGELFTYTSTLLRNDASRKRTLRQ